MSKTHLMLDIPTNLIIDPEDFAGSAWTAGGDCTVVVNTDTAPDGTLTADRIESDTTTPYGDNVFQDVALTAATNAPYTYTVHVKKETADDLLTVLYLYDGSTIIEEVLIRLDLIDGSIIFFNSVTTSGPGYSQDNLTVETVSASGGDYWRVGFTLTDYSGRGDSYKVRHYPWTQGSGQPARTIVLWGAQLLNKPISYPYFNSNSKNSATITPLYRTNETGALQVKILGGSCGNVKLQGTAKLGLNWHDIKVTDDMGGFNEPTEVLYTNLPLLPHLRVRMIQSSNVSLKVFLME